MGWTEDHCTSIAGVESNVYIFVTFRDLSSCFELGTLTEIFTPFGTALTSSVDLLTGDFYFFVRFGGSSLPDLSNISG